MLPGLVYRAQSAFVEGRSILDNVLIAFEILCSVKNKRRGKMGDIMLKIDISKANDRVDWTFLRKILSNLGFSIKWVEWMMLCVTSVSYSVLVNDDLVGSDFTGEGFKARRSPIALFVHLVCRGVIVAYKQGL